MSIYFKLDNSNRRKILKIFVIGFVALPKLSWLLSGNLGLKAQVLLILLLVFLIPCYILLLTSKDITNGILYLVH